MLEVGPRNKVLDNGFTCFGVKNNQTRNSLGLPLNDENEDVEALVSALETLEKRVKSFLPLDAVLQSLMTVPKEFGKSSTLNIYFNSYSTFVTPFKKLIDNPFIALKNAFKGVFYIDVSSVSYSEKTNKWYINICLHTIITTPPKIIGLEYMK